MHSDRISTIKTIIMKLSIVLFSVPIIESLIMFKIIPDSLYNPHSLCTFLEDRSNLAILQNCIWECENNISCHTSVYFNSE
jgi:hypothetical protein